MKQRELSCDCEHDRLAQRVANLEAKLFGVMERNAQSEEENARLHEEVARLHEQDVRLEQQLAAARKDSSTSSRPPSSDIVKPKKPLAKGGKKRNKGGQPGHEHMRSPFPPEAVNHFEPHTLDYCPDCGGRLVASRREPEVLQQVEIVETPTVLTEHRGLAYWCPHCRKVHDAPMTESVVKAGLFGPRLTPLVAFMKGVCHASFSTIRKFLRDVVRVKVSRGYLAKLIGKVSEALAPAYAELFERLPGEPVLNIDETGHKENGQKFWTWCFLAQFYRLFRIDTSRGSKVLVEVLGEEFNGVLGCDYFSAYRKYMREFDVLVQFCLAHLIRDVKFLLTLPGREVQAYGQRVRDALRELFGVIHRRDQPSVGARMSVAGFQKALEAAREQVMKGATTRVPDAKHARNLAKRFRENGEAYFRFITTPGIEGDEQSGGTGDSFCGH
ncbi:MAG: IS66 family transposase [Thermoguttaceae bacterium]|jgi:transposase|nr:IS66 family transposase [Thermoguttaceae bacterium]